MKKLLAIALTLALLLGLAVPAMAAEEAEPFANPPLATHITAEWNGEIMIWPGGTARFTHETVAIAVHFDDTSRLFDRDWTSVTGDIRRWHWNNGIVLGTEGGISVNYIAGTGQVRVIYADDALFQTWLADNTNWTGTHSQALEVPAFIETLPQTTFGIPLDYLAQFIDSHRPLNALTFGQPQLANEPTNVFTFTPATTARYTFTPRLPGVFDQNLERIEFNNDEVLLLAGQTYYIIFSGGSTPITVTQISLFQRLVAQPFQEMLDGLLAYYVIGMFIMGFPFLFAPIILPILIIINPARIFFQNLTDIIRIARM